MTRRVLFVLFPFFLVACGGSSPPAETSQTAQAPASNSAPAASAAVKRVDACSLFTKAEIQTFLGRTPMDGRLDDAAELSVCTYGNPAAPVVAGNPTDVLLKVAIFNGSLPGQAKGVYDIAKSNAAEVQAVSGVGDEAYWDSVLRGFHAVKGNYMVDVTVGADLGDLKTAQAIGQQTVARLL